MKPDGIHRNHFEHALMHRGTYNWLYIATWAPISGALLAVLCLLLVLNVDPLSLPGLSITFAACISAGLIGRAVFRMLRPPKRYYFVAFSAPRWDAQLAETIEIDMQGADFFVDSVPVLSAVET